MDRREIAEACESLPLFPLARVVLMPGTLLPLHVFEFRYRDMIAHSMAGHRVVAVATLRPGFEEDRGAPPIHPEVGVGRIVSYQPFPDGRSNVVLKHVASARIAEELGTDHPFRLARAIPTDVRDEDFGPAAGELRALVLRVGSLTEKAAVETRRLAALRDRDMVDALAQRLIEDPEGRLEYLCVGRLVQRVAMVRERLTALLRVPGLSMIEA